MKGLVKLNFLKKDIRENSKEAQSKMFKTVFKAIV